MEEKLKKLHFQLKTIAVFRGVLDTPALRAFNRYCDTDKNLKHTAMDAYSRFVFEIYNHGGNWTKMIQKSVFEDENVYVKSVAQKIGIDQHIKNSVCRELEILSNLACLTTSDFATDLGVDESIIPAFSSYDIDLMKAYQKRLKSIRKVGYGIFSSCGMFRLADDKKIEPILSADKISMDSFIGYNNERNQVVENTRAFVEGRPAANTLLCGDAGSGKSSTVKAVANAFFDEGIRLIELRKDQLSLLPYVMGKIVGNPLKFIIFIDDLAFNRSDDNFSMLKAALEGSASAKADNAVIYATSNRRHIIKECFGDREGDDVHRNDTLQETLSLAERFGLVVLFSKPNKTLYLEIVHELAKRFSIEMDKTELDIKAEAFALKKGNRSARCAEQFIQSLL